MLTMPMMIDWFVLLTPFAVLPISLLLVFVGCAAIFGIEGGMLAKPITFIYEQDMPNNVQVIAWEFETENLVYPGGADAPAAFDEGPFLRGAPDEPPIDRTDGETELHHEIGVPLGGEIKCTCLVRLAGVEDPIVQEQFKSPDDVDFKLFFLNNDLVLL